MPAIPPKSGEGKTKKEQVMNDLENPTVDQKTGIVRVGNLYYSSQDAWYVHKESMREILNDVSAPVAEQIAGGLQNAYSSEKPTIFATVDITNPKKDQCRKVLQQTYDGMSLIQKYFLPKIDDVTVHDPGNAHTIHASKGQLSIVCQDFAFTASCLPPDLNIAGPHEFGHVNERRERTLWESMRRLLSSQREQLDAKAEIDNIGNVDNPILADLGRPPRSGHECTETRSEWFGLAGPLGNLGLPPGPPMTVPNALAPSSNFSADVHYGLLQTVRNTHPDIAWEGVVPMRGIATAALLLAGYGYLKNHINIFSRGQQIGRDSLVEQGGMRGNQRIRESR